VSEAPETLRLSVAVPVFQEREVLPELVARLGRVLDELPGDEHEIVFVDDGSSDGSAEVLAELAAADPRIIAVRLSRNFGHQAAISAALDHVSGDAVVVMDGDLQDPPEAIPVLVDKYHEGFDVVFSRRVKRKESWWLRAGYFLHYRLLAALSELPLPIDSGDFALLGARVVKELRRLPEHNRYLRGLRTWVGFRQVGVEIERGRRAAGTSKYTPWKLVRLATDGILSFSVVPLRAAGCIGLGAVALAAVYAAYAIAAKLFLGTSPRGFTAVVAVVVFLSGTQLLFLGLVGEYVARIYEETKRRPLYVVERVIGRD